ncbi:MAG: hypothetical protein ACO2ZZ_03020 [Cyclobacteriaceae bacterium]
MRKFSLILCLLIGLQLSAQENIKPWSYNFGVGTTYRFPNSYGPELNTLLTSRSSFPQIATNISFGTNYQIADQLSVGIQTLGVFYPKVETSAAQVTLAGIGADIKAYYRLVETLGASIHLFLGIGVHNLFSSISNDGFLVNRDPLFIPPGNTQYISGQMGYVNAGAQLWKVASDSFSLGLSGGYIIKFSGTDWKTSWGEAVDVLTPPTLSLLYLRVSVSLKSRK